MYERCKSEGMKRLWWVKREERKQQPETCRFFYTRWDCKRIQWR